MAHDLSAPDVRVVAGIFPVTSRGYLALGTIVVKNPNMCGTSFMPFVVLLIYATNLLQ